MQIVSTLYLMYIKRTVWKMILVKVEGVGRVQWHFYDMTQQFNIKSPKIFFRVNDNKTELFKMIADVVTCKCEEGIVEEEKRLHGMRGAVSLKLLNAFWGIFILYSYFFFLFFNYKIHVVTISL